MLSELPVELRLRIAEYAFEQRPAAGIPHIGAQLFHYTHDYRPSENMALLLVCRQFNLDFTALAYNKTRFLLFQRHTTRMQELPPHKLRNIRRLTYWGSEMEHWGSYFCDLEQLRLKELVLVFDVEGMPMFKALTSFMRRLVHVKTVKFVIYGKREDKNRSKYCSFIGLIMKEDHFQRYDAPDAPNVEATWWDWRLNPQANIITFKAQDPRPILPEEEYILLMKPKVDALMAEAERASQAASRYEADLRRRQASWQGIGCP